MGRHPTQAELRAMVNKSFANGAADRDWAGGVDRAREQARQGRDTGQIEDRAQNG